MYSSSESKRYSNGYDSDGMHAPWLDNEQSTQPVTIEDEEPLPPRTERQAAPESSNANPNPTVLTLSVDNVRRLKVAELRVELRKRGIAVTGNKALLVERLCDAIEKNVPLVGGGEGEVGGNTGGGARRQNQADPTYDVGSYWELLEQDGDDVEDDFNVAGGDNFYAPTVPQGENTQNHAKKKNYSQMFDRPVFCEKTKLPKTFFRGGRERLLRNRRTKEVVYEEVPCKETVPNIDWCCEHSLELTSHPAQWFEAFFPIKNCRGVTNSYSSNAFSMENILSWTNTKAQMQNAGLGGKYPDFKNFSLDELMKHFALYLFQGLSPSPQVEMKFHSSKEDPMNGNDFIFNAFGCKPGHAKRRHKHFKAFMACVNPTFPTPERDLHPNWKVHPLLKHMLVVNKKAIHLGQHLSCDEQTIGFQGHHRDKQRITYKAEGDGFLADCICSDGYTYNFYFRHQPDPTYRRGDDNQLSPLHRRVLSLISQLPGKNYTLGMDNLYNSAKLSRVAKATRQRVMTHGVVRVSGRGVPAAVIQKEVSRKEDQEKVRHTVKAAVVKGDSVNSDLLCISIYDTKPVYIMTNACFEIKWIRKGKKIWSKALNKYVNGYFHRLNVIDFYNNNMGNVDLADQLRNYYRYDTQWHRNRKWWWSVFWWAFQLLMTNAYIAYSKYHKVHLSTNVVSHYDFIKQIALAWMDPRKYGPNAEVVEEELNGKRKKEVITVDDSDDDNATNCGWRMVSKRRIRLKTGEDDMTVCTEVTESSAGSSSRNARVNDQSLDPGVGALKCRLDSFSNHFPEHFDDKRAGKCQLHRWARGRKGKEVRNAKVLHCSTCNVSLCSKCWKVFHGEEDLIGKKDDIAKS